MKEPVYMPLEDQNNVCAFLVSLDTETLGAMLNDIESMLAQANVPEFQHEVLLEWGEYIAREILCREDAPPCDCEQCSGCGEEQNEQEETEAPGLDKSKLN